MAVTLSQLPWQSLYALPYGATKMLVIAGMHEMSEMDGGRQ